MPGPNSGYAMQQDVRALHEKCQQKRNCKGPGCRVTTGKTAANRRARKGTANKLRVIFGNRD